MVDPKIHIAIPNVGWISRDVCIWKAQSTSGSTFSGGRRLVWNLATHKPYDSAVNRYVRDCLDDGGDYLVICDADNAPTRCPLELVDLDLDIVGCPTPIFHRNTDPSAPSIGGVIWNVCDYDPDLDTWKNIGSSDGLVEVDAVGAGFMIIARRVLERFRSEGVAAWLRRLDDDGVQTHGSDFEFCRRARAFGFRVFASFDHICHHQKSVDLLAFATRSSVEMSSEK